MTTQATLATSTGPVWIMLVTHVLGGAIALASGFLAIVVTKGGRLHRRAGMVFVVAMLVMSVFGSIVASYEMKLTAIGALLTAYFVLTGLDTVRPIASLGRSQRIALAAVALLIALFEWTTGTIAFGRPHAAINGVPGEMMLFLGTVAFLGAVGDVRVMRADGIRGTRRVARHLWRMCFALFIASGSFFLGQMKFVPAPLRNLPLMMLLGVSPLLALLYWMWRIRFRQSLRGMVVNSPRHSVEAVR